ncbi:MAG: PilZ domain-containing protein [Deltaproteobacteria bacterium]|nr:PilZ domain-containing protein [Deltaproteobacteria bacterium]
MIFRERKYERFEYEAPVLYKAPDKNIWQYGIILDVSMGGLLIKSPNLPRKQSNLEIRLSNMIEGNFIRLEGKIVRFVDPPRGPAMGIEFLIPESSPELRKLIETIQISLRPIVNGQQATEEQKNEAVRYARELLENASYMDYYSTLELKSDVLEDDLGVKSAEIVRTLSIQYQGISENESKIIHEAITMVKRISGILGNPERRLGYDLSSGKIEPSVVEYYAKKYQMDMSEFMSFYSHKFPERVKKAEKLMMLTREYLDSGNPMEAQRTSEEARKLAPFHFKYGR